MPTDDSHPVNSDPSLTSPQSRKQPGLLKQVFSVLILLLIIGMWAFSLTVTIQAMVRGKGLLFVTPMVIFFAALTGVSFIGFGIAGWLNPAIPRLPLARVSRWVIGILLAAYIFYPTYEKFRGEDDIYLATLGLFDGRSMQDAKRSAPTLKVLQNNGKTFRVEISKRDGRRLERKRYKLIPIQSPAERRKVEKINKLPPGFPNVAISEMIGSVSSDSLLNDIRRLERYGTRVEYSPQEDSAAEYLIREFRRYGLNVESLTFGEVSPRLSAFPGMRSRNICATLKGSGRAAEEVLLVGHYDSAHLTVPGGNDNASGTAALLEAARICSRYKFERTIRFLAVAAEERGLVGSAMYARDAKMKGENIIAVVNADMIGYPVLGDSKRIAITTGKQWSALMDSALLFNRRYSLGLVLDAHLSPFGGSDHESFIRYGYPAIDISEGTAMEIWRGFDPYYHRPLDTSDKLDRNLVRHSVQLMIAIAAETARPLEGIENHMR
jgi:hypothetical protein